MTTTKVADAGCQGSPSWGAVAREKKAPPNASVPEQPERSGIAPHGSLNQTAPCSSPLVQLTTAGALPAYVKRMMESGWFVQAAAPCITALTPPSARPAWPGVVCRIDELAVVS